VTELSVVWLAPEHAGAWSALFVRAECPCFCRWWHFEGDKNAWLDRCANRPDENRDEQLVLLGHTDDAVRSGAGALIATHTHRGATEVVGHMKLAPRAALPKLRNRPVHKRLDLGSDDGVWSIGCVLVDPAWRGKGVSRLLLRAAPELARARGGSALEGYPRRSSEALRDDEIWMGPEGLYASEGFIEVGGDGPYPVFRKMLM
jgi:GNAT superfamily N-acetyltransferase